jgi:hypothetical protein
MTYIIFFVALAAGVVTAVSIEWIQRHCEAWAFTREKDL